MTDSNSAETLKQHPKYIQGKKLLIEALVEVTETLSLNNFPVAAEYCQLMDQLQNQRGMAPFYPFLGSGLGRGPLVELFNGSVKYDMITGIGPNIFGHSYPQIAEACIDGALSDTVMESNLLPNQDALELMKQLTNISGLPHCFLSTSGAMACENALKIILQKKQPAARILAFDGCFMGRTLALSQITDKPAYRQGLPQFLQVDYLPFYSPSLSLEENFQNVRSAAESYFKRYPQKHACCCIELVQGEGGIRTAPREFFLKVIEFLKLYNVLILVDEVQTFARTQELFAFHTLQLQHHVDVVTIGKTSSVCATLFTHELTPQPGLISQTFTASASAIRAALWFLQYGSQILCGENGKNRLLGDYFRNKFKELNAEIPGSCQPPYGLGALLAFTIFDWEQEKVHTFLKTLFTNGVIAFTAGSHPTRVRLLPPLGAMTIDDIDTVMQIIKTTIEQMRNGETRS